MAFADEKKINVLNVDDTMEESALAELRGSNISFLTPSLMSSHYLALIIGEGLNSFAHTCVSV